jgi:quinol monooxygenase YgiN
MRREPRAAAVHSEAHGLLTARFYPVREAIDAPTGKERSLMTAPFIFVGTHRIKEGQLDAYIEYFREFVEFVKENEPRLIVFEGFVNDEGSRMTIVQVHPDAESMEFHMQTIGKHIGEAYDRFLDRSERIDVYGVPRGGVVEMIKQLASTDVPLNVSARPVAGFTRSTEPVSAS